MRNLSIAILAALSLFAFAGCKKKGGSDAVAKLTEFKDAMCKCTDKACADKVMADMTKWTQEAAGKGEAAKPSEDDVKKSQAISEEYAKCMQKVMASMTVPPPAAPPAGDKPADPAAAPPAGEPAAPAGDKPADPAAPAAPAGDKPAEPK